MNDNMRRKIHAKVSIRCGSTTELKKINGNSIPSVQAWINSLFATPYSVQMLLIAGKLTSDFAAIAN